MFYKKIPLLLFFVPLFAFSERIKFSLDTETGEEETVVTVPLEWNEKWISGGTSETYNHELARVACVLSDSAYCDVEGTTRSLVSNYVSLGVKKSDIELHYDINYDAPIIGNNQAAHSFANVHLKNGKDLVFIVIRGTTRNANEWISNINISDTSRTAQEIHEGFYYTELEIHKELIYYLLTHKLSPENTSFLITGHSRGGAVANLLGQHMSDEGYFSKENIYVYTFAAPNIASKKNYEGRDYNFIWNIVNPEDVVPTVPPCREGWDYNKPGHMLSLFSYWTVTPGLYEKEYLPKINSWFNKFCARDYYPFKIGTFIPSIITRGLTGFYETVDGYYASRLRVSKKIESLFWKLFPAKGKELDVDEESGSASRLFDKLAATFNEQTNGLLDYSAFAFSDMHSCKTYLSFMLSFDEKTV
ncbi:MAG: lipase family protein, partial [Treponema sp.]|nr:lipase family protein [Treponema sp.]